MKGLLEGTGNHYRAVAGALSALAVSQRELARTVAGSLNTLPRRELGLRDIALASLTGDAPDFRFVAGLARELTIAELRDDVLMHLALAISASKAEQTPEARDLFAILDLL